jgi:hypothetical protein
MEPTQFDFIFGFYAKLLIKSTEVVFTTQDFRIKKKKGANVFTSSKHFTRAFFILA